MGSLIPKLIATGLGASVSPVAIMAITSVMLKKKPLRSSLFFLMGFSLLLVSVGVVVLLFLNVGGGIKKGHESGYIDIGLGVLCLVGLVLVIRRKPKPAQSEEPGEIKPFKAFTLGIMMMFVNTSTWVIYLSGVHLIDEAKLNATDNIITMVVLTFVTLITLLIPITIEALFPKTADKMLDWLRAWLAKHRKLIGAIILLVFAVYLLERGIEAVV